MNANLHHHREQDDRNMHRPSFSVCTMQQPVADELADTRRLNLLTPSPDKANYESMRRTAYHVGNVVHSKNTTEQHQQIGQEGKQPTALSLSTTNGTLLDSVPNLSAAALHQLIAFQTSPSTKIASLPNTVTGLEAGHSISTASTMPSELLATPVDAELLVPIKQPRPLSLTETALSLPTPTVDSTGRRLTFPEKLMHLLSMPECQHGMSWLPEGKAFVIHPLPFLRYLLPRYFDTTKFESFTRKLNRWGFKRVLPGYGEPGMSFAYYHRFFQRDYPELCRGMSGGKKAEQDLSYLINEKKKASHPKEELKTGPVAVQNGIPEAGGHASFQQIKVGNRWRIPQQTNRAIARQNEPNPTYGMVVTWPQRQWASSHGAAAVATGHVPGAETTQHATVIPTAGSILPADSPPTVLRDTVIGVHGGSSALSRCFPTASSTVPQQRFTSQVRGWWNTGILSEQNASIGGTIKRDILTKEAMFPSIPCAGNFPTETGSTFSLDSQSTQLLRMGYELGREAALIAMMRHSRGSRNPIEIVAVPEQQPQKQQQEREQPVSAASITRPIDVGTDALPLTNGYTAGVNPVERSERRQTSEIETTPTPREPTSQSRTNEEHQGSVDAETLARIRQRQRAFLAQQGFGRAESGRAEATQLLFGKRDSEDK